MGKVRVIAYFMHESEEEAARKKLSNVHGTKSYLLGDIEERDIGQIEQQGIVVQRLEDEPAPKRVAHGTATPMAVDLGGPPVTTGMEFLDTFGPAPALSGGPENFYAIRIAGPLLESWRQQLEEYDVKLLERTGSGTYTARLTPQYDCKKASYPVTQTNLQETWIRKNGDAVNELSI